jgi:hypothetical protein
MSALPFRHIERRRPNILNVTPRPDPAGAADQCGYFLAGEFGLTFEALGSIRDKE